MRALITGGAKRLGREMSLYLAKRGYDVAVHYNSSDDDARAVVDEIHAMGRVQRSCRQISWMKPKWKHWCHALLRHWMARSQFW